VPQPASPAKSRHLREIAPQGGYARAAALGPQECTAKLRAGFMARFEREAAERFPDDKPADRAWRADLLLKQYMADLGRRSKRARRADR
jgi:hypothetical protein